MKRVLTSLVLVAFAYYAIFPAPPWFFFGTVMLMAVLCYSEFITIVRGHGIMGPLWIGYPIGLLAIAVPDSIRPTAVLLLGTALGARQLSQALPFAAAVALGVLYIFFGWRFAVDLRAITPYWILYALAINWAGDIAAYYVGRSIGKHKLAPRISPGKSWEGAVASLIAAVLLSVAAADTVLQITVPHAIWLGIVANIAGQIGDLAESAMKRGAGIKDSGTLLPGHGGFLDRLDSSLFTMPVVYTFLTYTNAGS